MRNATQNGCPIVRENVYGAMYLVQMYIANIRYTLVVARNCACAEPISNTLYTRNASTGVMECAHTKMAFKQLHRFHQTRPSMLIKQGD